MIWEEKNSGYGMDAYEKPHAACKDDADFI